MVPDFSCTDDVAVATCNGSVAVLDTATAGTKTFTVTATDTVGNPATKTVSYVVDPPPAPTYNFGSGFSQPVDMNAVNTAKAGQTVPVKWRLTSNGAPVSDPASFVSATSSLVSCATGVPTDAIEEYTASASGLQYQGDGNWQYNWKTPKTYAGQCRTFTINLAGRPAHHGQLQALTSGPT